MKGAVRVFEFLSAKPVSLFEMLVSLGLLGLLGVCWRMVRHAFPYVFIFTLVLYGLGVLPPIWDVQAKQRVLGPYHLVHVLTRVEGIDEPAVLIGHELEIEGEICTRSKTDVLVETYPYIRKLGDGVAEPPLQRPGGQLLREAGCKVINRKIGLPDGLTPGSYQVYANDVVCAKPLRIVNRTAADPDGECEGTGETLTWKSQPFRLVGR